MSSEVVIGPSGLEVDVRSMTVRDFRLLNDRKAARDGTTVANLLRACTLEVKSPGPYPPGAIDWNKVLLGDQMHTMIAVRRITHGDNFDFDVTCGARDCKSRISWRVALSELPVRKYSKEALALFTSGTPCTTTVDGRKIEFAHVTVELAQRASKLSQDEDRKSRGLDRGPRRAKDDDEGPNALAEALLVRLISVEGVDKADHRTWVEDLPLGELSRIRNGLEEFDGGVETQIAVECSRCGAVTELELPLDLRRFWLSATR